MREHGTLREWQVAQCGWNTKFAGGTGGLRDMRLRSYVGPESSEALEAIFWQLDFILEKKRHPSNVLGRYVM